MMGIEFKPRLASAISLFLLSAGALMAPSQAAATTAPMVLPDAISYEYTGIVFFVNERSSTSVGTLTYVGPGCGGLCSATTALGADPSASVTVDEVGYDNSGGGTATSNLGYYVEYLNAPGTYNITLHATDALFTGTASASAYLEFGPASNSYADFNNFSAKELIEQSSTDASCLSCALGIEPAFQPDNVVQMIANTLYFIQIGANLDLESDGIPNGASVDPVFSDMGAGGTFAFSPGVISSVAAVPETGTWAMMLIGIGMTGVMKRYARNGRAGFAGADRKHLI